MPGRVSSTPFAWPVLPEVTTIAAVPAGAGRPSGARRPLARRHDPGRAQPRDQPVDLGPGRGRVEREDRRPLVPGRDRGLGEVAAGRDHGHDHGFVGSGHRRYPNDGSDHSHNRLALIPGPRTGPQGPDERARKRRTRWRQAMTPRTP